MSLQLAAQHLADKGRGPDTTLVHMSNKEVKSLNDLAMAHGGQLTINPQTGLPEAGFLSAILPLVAGAALGPAGFGLTAMQAGLLVGAGSYALNPKGGLMGGLSAGLGGYGGAGLGAGLSGLATSEAGASVQNVANEGAQQELARQTAQQQAQQAIINASPEAAGFATPSALPSADQLATIKSNIVNEQLLANPPPTGFDAVKQGAKSLFTDPTADKFKALGGGSYSGLARMGLAAAAPAAGEQAKFTPPPTSATAGKQVVPHYKFSPGMQTPTPTASPTGVENVYFKPQYTALSDEEAKQMYPGYGAYVPPTTAADGGLMGYTGGGPVEQMSTNAMMGVNTMYPMANIAPFGGGAMNMMSGGQRMADGGVSYDPKTQRYSKGISEALRPENRDVNIYNDTGGIGSGGGPASASSSSSSTGSPTGSTIGDIGYAISNQSISPMAAAIAQAAMDAMSPTSNTSANAVNGMDAASDAASAASAAAAAADASGGAPGMGGGSDASSGDSGAAGGGGGGDAGGEARGGLSPRFTHHMADGGISGRGHLDLNIPLDFGNGSSGGFGGGGANGYSAAGSGGGSQTGFTGQNNTAIGAKGGAGLSPLFNTGQTPFDNTFEGDTFQPQGTRAFGGNPQQMIGLLSSLMQGQQSGNASAPQPMQMASGGISDAGYNLGGYSDGGRLLRGPGDGVSDSIPAVIGKRQPARLADGEFVVPARIVSELGNGSTEAGARKLYAMMDRIQAARGKTVGKGRVAKNSRSEKYLPA